MNIAAPVHTGGYQDQTGTYQDQKPNIAAQQPSPYLPKQSPYTPAAFVYEVPLQMWLSGALLVINILNSSTSD